LHMSSGAKWRREVWGITRGLTKFEIQILKCVAHTGPLNINQIKKELSSAYSSTRKTTFRLVRRGTLAESGPVIVKHTGLETQTYNLSLIGVLFVLREKLSEGMETWSQKHVNRIIRKYKSLLPLVFGKWGHLNRMGVLEMALFRVKGIVDTYTSDPNSFRKGVGHYPWLEIEEQITRFFYFFGFFPRTWTGWKGVEDPKAWMTMWKQDEDIRTYVIDGIQEELEKFRKATIRGRNILSFLQKD